MRNVAILRDGYSDFLVVRKFIKCILNSHKGEILDDKSFIDLEQLNITNPLVKYIDKVSRSKDYSYHSEEATVLIKELIAIYFACYSRFQREFDVITNKEVIVINADSEKLLIERGNYFSIWAYNIKGLLLFSIEKFYEEMIKQGYTFEYLPFIVPLILYPSSEILIASCMYNITHENLRQLKPTPSLKEGLWNR
jgi:hypothetical protein